MCIGWAYCPLDRLYVMIFWGIEPCFKYIWTKYLFKNNNAYEGKTSKPCTLQEILYGERGLKNNMTQP